MFNGWKITNIFDVGPCELDTIDGPYSKTGYRLERREGGFAITVGLMEHISGWSAWEVLGWLNEKQAITTEFTGGVAVRVKRLVMRFLMEEIMVQIEKIHTDFWTFTVFDKFIKACPTRKNRYSGDQIRIYARLSDFERDFGDFEEYGKIRDLYTDSKTPTKKVSV